MAETAPDTTRWESLEQWSPIAFLVAGVLLVVFAALLGYEAFTDMPAPEDLFGPPGFSWRWSGCSGCIRASLTGPLGWRASVPSEQGSPQWDGY
ncbi:hypothetical protein ACFQMM_01905 [Saliphagus sp. GCM10025308]